MFWVGCGVLIVSAHDHFHFIIQLTLNISNTDISNYTLTEPHSTVGSASDSRARGPGFDTLSGHILLFLLPLIQEGHLSVTGKSMCRKYWLTLRRSKPAQEKCG